MLEENSNKDKELILLLQRGDKEAIAHILEQYGDAIYGVIYNIVHSEETAKRLMQEACVRIWRNGSSYDPNKGKLFAWLLRVARNTALDTIRTGAVKR